MQQYDFLLLGAALSKSGAAAARAYGMEVYVSKEATIKSMVDAVNCCQIS